MLGTTTTSFYYHQQRSEQENQYLQYYSSTEKSTKEEKEEEKEEEDSLPKKEDDDTATFFDITKQWEDVKADWEQLLGGDKNDSSNPSSTPPSTNNDESSVFEQLRKAIGNSIGNDNKNTSTQTPSLSSSPTPPPPSEENYKDMGKTLVQLVKQQVAGMSSSSSTITVQDIVTEARAIEEQGDVNDAVSLTQLLEIAQISKKQLDDNLDEFLGNNSGGGEKKLPTITPTDIYYFLEHEDETKNPSVKRRVHRYFSGIDVSQVERLNHQLELADLSYTDTLEELQTALETKKFNYELAYCDMNSTPGRPSHFVAVNKNQQQQTGPSFWNDNSSVLEVILVVRGTKTVTDVITDLLCDAAEYKGGYCHKGILKSGQYLAQKHLKLFQNLLQVSGKQKIKLTLIGHSLGAGAASIAGMELQNKSSFLDVQVVGFGCPALLSEDLSKKAESFITTVVADNDCIPRMSTATMLNAILDIASYNWIPKAQRDVEDAIDQIELNLPKFLGKGVAQTAQTILKSIDKETLRPQSEIPRKRMQPILFPPGKCIHLYRDGFGISGNVVPCNFFGALDFNRRMLHDHLYTGYKIIFLDLMRQHTDNHSFQFDVK